MTSARSELTVERRELHDILKVMAKVYRGRGRGASSVPILGYVKLKALARSLTVEATDLDNEVVATIEAKDGRKWESTAPFDELLRIVAGATSDRIALSFDPETSDLTVGCDESQSSFTLKTLPAADFPSHREFETTHSFDIAAADLAEAIAHVVFAVSKEETRYYLNGIYFESLSVDGKPTLRLVATDGHRLAAFDLKRPTGIAKMPGTIVPRKTISILEAMLKRADTVAVKVGKSGIEVTAGGLALSSKLIDGTYPDYQRVIPKDLVRSATMSTSAMMTTCRRMSAFTNPRGRALALAFDPETGLTVSVKGDFGTAKTTVPVTIDGDPFIMGVNAAYLTEAFSRLGAGEAVMDLGADGGCPVRIRTPDKPRYQIIQMPMRV